MNFTYVAAIILAVTDAPPPTSTAAPPLPTTTQSITTLDLTKATPPPPTTTNETPAPPPTTIKATPPTPTTTNATPAPPPTTQSTTINILSTTIETLYLDKTCGSEEEGGVVECEHGSCIAIQNFIADPVTKYWECQCDDGWVGRACDGKNLLSRNTCTVRHLPIPFSVCHRNGCF